VEVSFSKNIASQIENAPFFWSIENAPFFFEHSVMKKFPYNEK
jgi:hypothetical protein